MPRASAPPPEALTSSPATSVEAVAGYERMQRIAWLGAASWGGFTLVYALLERPILAAINGAAALASGGAVWVLRGEPSPARTQAAVHIGLGSGTLALIAAAQVAGQAASQPLWYLPLVPFVGGLLGDRRVTLTWTSVAMLGVVFTHALAVVMPIPQEYESGRVEHLLGQITLLVLALAAASATRRGTDAALRRVRERERTIRRQSVELAGARDVAEAASRAKSEFLATMTHELRTPLNGLIGPVEVLARSDLDSSQRATLEIIESSARALRNLVDSILDFSKIEAGRMELRPTRARIRRSVHETLRVFEALATARRVTLSVEFGERVPTTLGLDQTRFQQTLINLVGNAVKFTRDGFVRVQVDYERGPDELRVCVQDSGVGIPDEALPGIFEAFRQVDSSSTREFGGTGLGLAICARLVQLAGGTIGVNSRVGEGTRFTFTWPAEALDDEDASRSEPAFRLPGGLRVLVAEDEPVNQQVMTMMLAQLGVAPTLVDNGRAALERASEHDVVFMDMRLPGLNGLDASEAIRAECGASRPWIIAATANATEHDRARCLAAGMNDFVSKPLQLAHLARALERAEAALLPDEEGLTE